MRQWKPLPSPGLWIGVLLLLLDLAALGVVATRVVAALLQPPDTWAIGLPLYAQVVALVALLIIAGLLAYRIAAALTLTYELDRNGLAIRWLGNRAIIPMMQIERIDSGDPHARIPRHLLQGIGYYSGQMVQSTASEHEQVLHLFTTRTPAHSLIITTSTAAYAIAPRQQDEFVQQLEQRRRLGVTTLLTATTEPGHLFFYAFWHDRVVRRVLLLATGLTLLLAGLLIASYPQLGDVVATRFDAEGHATEHRPRAQVLFLPLAALLVLLLNTLLGLRLYASEKAATYLLLVAAVLVQLLFGVAILELVLHG